MFVVATVLLVVPAIMFVIAAAFRRFKPRLRAFDNFVKLAAVEPDAATARAIIYLDALTVSHR